MLTHKDQTRPTGITKGIKMEAIKVVSQYENFFTGINDADFKLMSRDEILEMLNAIKNSLKNKEKSI